MAPGGRGDGLHCPYVRGTPSLCQGKARRGSGRSSTASITLKTVVPAPLPDAGVQAAARAKSGRRGSVRGPNSLPRERVLTQTGQERCALPSGSFFPQGGEGVDTGGAVSRQEAGEQGDYGQEQGDTGQGRRVIW